MSILLEYYRSGGPVMHVILVLAVLGLGVFLERAWVIITNSKGSDRAFIEKVVVLARAGKTDEAVRLCHSHKTAMTYIGELVLRSPSRSESDLQNAADAARVASLPPSPARAGGRSRAERLSERADEFSVRLITALSTKASEGRES